MTIGYFAACAVLSIVAGFFLMSPLAWLFESMDWPYFHSWGLAHGAFLVAWPMLSLMSFPPVVFGGRCLRKWLRNRSTSDTADF